MRVEVMRIPPSQKDLNNMKRKKVITQMTRVTIPMTTIVKKMNYQRKVSPGMNQINKLQKKIGSKLRGSNLRKLLTLKREEKEENDIDSTLSLIH